MLRALLEGITKAKKNLGRSRFKDRLLPDGKGKFQYRPLFYKPLNGYEHGGYTKVTINSGTMIVRNDTQQRWRREAAAHRRLTAVPPTGMFKALQDRRKRSLRRVRARERAREQA